MLTGSHVVATHIIRSLSGIVLLGTEGVVLYPIERLGDPMAVVEFTNGEKIAVFPWEVGDAEEEP